MSLQVLVESWKVALQSGLSLDRDSLHIHVGLVIFFAVALLARVPLRSRWPWLAALCAALLGEAIDLSGQHRLPGYGSIYASIHDIVNTMFWPTALWLLSRWSAVMKRQ